MFIFFRQSLVVFLRKSERTSTILTLSAIQLFNNYPSIHRQCPFVPEFRVMGASQLSLGKGRVLIIII